MSVQEIMHQVESLSSDEQNQVAAFLTHLRHKKDQELYAKLAQRAGRPAGDWKSLDDFENGQR